MRNKIIFILIMLRHGINPFGKVAKNVDAMKQRLTDKEKELLINRTESEIDRKIWRMWLY